MEEVNVYLGCFAPLHNGHGRKMKYLARLGYLMVGVANRKVSKCRPFTLEESVEMVEEFLKDNSIDGKVFPIKNMGLNPVNYLKELHKYVPKGACVVSLDFPALIVHKLFGLKVKKLPSFTDETRGSNVRKRIYDSQVWENDVPESTKKVIEKPKVKKRLEQLAKQQNSKRVPQGTSVIFNRLKLY